MAIRVLVVDDDPWILRMVTATLEKRGYVVDTAKEGRTALAKAQSAVPDILITDVMMPVMDGWTLVATIRQYPEMANIPVILLTALGKDEGKLRQLGLDAACYLAKPFRFDELEKRVSAALAEAPAAAAEASQSGVYAEAQQSGIYAAPPPGHPASNPQSGVYAMPLPPNQQSGAHPMPMPGYPGYPPQPGYPAYPTGYPQPGYPQPAYPGYPQPGYPPYPPQPGYMPGHMQPGPPPPAPGPAPASVNPPAHQAPPQRATPPPQRHPTGPPSLDDAPPPGSRPTREHRRIDDDFDRRPSGEHQRHGSGERRAHDSDELPRHDSGETPRQPSGEHNRRSMRRQTALNGRLEQLGLSSLLVMMEMERKDGVLSVKNREGGAVGRIFLRGGQVVSARLDGLDALSGKQSVYEMLAWDAGTFSFSATKVDMEDSIQSSTTHLLMEGARLIDEAKRDTF
jgi:CheY-like chemotaxis protein